jgi:hypothetical protein
LTPAESEEPGHQVLDSDLLTEVSPEPPQASGPVVPVPRGKPLEIPHNTADGHFESIADVCALKMRPYGGSARLSLADSAIQGFPLKRASTRTL